jgi:signal transduction histidine kinase
MPDYYHAPALILTLLVLPAFGHLYLRLRDARTRLWFLAFFSTLIAMLFSYTVKGWNFPPEADAWLRAGAAVFVQVSSALFLASMSPLQFRLGRFQILYVIPYILPLMAYAILLYGVFHGVAPTGPLFLIFPLLGVVWFCAVLCWSAQKYIIPAAVGIAVAVLVGGVFFWACFTLSAEWALVYAESCNLLVTALFMVFVFRRFTPGLALTVAGFVAWALPAFEPLPAVALNPALHMNLIHVLVMGKVVAALGMIVLTLEDELERNKTAQERERRARRELEAYTKLVLGRRRVEHFDQQGNEICEVVTAHSRFAQAALLLHHAGRYRLVGAAGLDAATAKALGDLAARLPAIGFLAPGSVPPAVEDTQTVCLDLTPWLRPGDDLKRLRFTSVLAVPMTSRTSNEGVLLLAGMQSLQVKNRRTPEPLRADDLLPIELLVARMQATRSQTMMFERLIDSEKYAHLGQLAANVSQELNNPLTVVLGYATLLEETSALEVQDRKAVESILAEARHMRSTLASLARISLSHGDQAAVSVAELLSDMGELHRSEFLSRSIEFQLNIAPKLPRALCSPQQLRQAVRHCLQFAMNAVENPAPAAEETKTIRVEAASQGNLVQILVGHSGPGFANPERAFDPFAAARADGEADSLGLSLCATILRDNNGRALAVNLEPQGAAIILELQAA